MLLAAEIGYRSGHINLSKFASILKSTSRREIHWKSDMGTWASVYEVYVAVVTATTLLLKLDAWVHNWASKGTSLGGAKLSSRASYSVLRCKLSPTLPKDLYGIISLTNAHRKTKLMTGLPSLKAMCPLIKMRCPYLTLQYTPLAQILWQTLLI